MIYYNDDSYKEVNSWKLVDGLTLPLANLKDPPGFWSDRKFKITIGYDEAFNFCPAKIAEDFLGTLEGLELQRSFLNPKIAIGGALQAQEDLTLNGNQKYVFWKKIKRGYSQRDRPFLIIFSKA
jgi:hypothetical protein